MAVLEAARTTGKIKFATEADDSVLCCLPVKKRGWSVRSGTWKRTRMIWRRFWSAGARYGNGQSADVGADDNYQDREIVDQVLAPLKELKLVEPSMVRTSERIMASFR